MSNIGFVGLGIMGKPMALNLIKGGHTLHLNSRSGVPAELTAAGGIACDSAKAVAQKSDVIIIMVPDTPDVEKVLFGTNGIAEGLSKGKLVIDMSSISPIVTKELAKRFAKLGWSSVLVIDGAAVDDGFARAARNIPGCDVLPQQGANVYDIMRRDTLVLTKDAVEALEARLK